MTNVLTFSSIKKNETKMIGRDKIQSDLLSLFGEVGRVGKTSNQNDCLCEVQQPVFTSKCKCKQNVIRNYLRIISKSLQSETCTALHGFVNLPNN